MQSTPLPLPSYCYSVFVVSIILIPILLQLFFTAIVNYSKLQKSTLVFSWLNYYLGWRGGRGYFFLLKGPLHIFRHMVMAPNSSFLSCLYIVGLCSTFRIKKSLKIETLYCPSPVLYTSNVINQIK